MGAEKNKREEQQDTHHLVGKMGVGETLIKGGRRQIQRKEGGVK